MPNLRRACPTIYQGYIWPIDLNAAITAIQKVVPPTSDVTPEKPPSKTPTPAMDSLPGDNPTPGVTNPTATETSVSEPQPPDKQPTPGLLRRPPSRSCPPTPQPPYPHQPYGYGHPPSAYPQRRTIHHLHLDILLILTPVRIPHNYNNTVSADDLPSYEEMIVEALTDSGDPEGCAPKDLFTWMASRYPLQSNFRPSASQALQKAYKRGGNTSRRTTRRPQTQNQSTTPSTGPPPASPFTHAPLVWVPLSTPSRLSWYPPQPPPAPASSTGDQPPVPEGSVADAYEAAQNILKAINFGGLLQMSKDEESNGIKSTNAQAGSATDATSAPSAPVVAGAGIDLSVTTQPSDTSTISVDQGDSSAGSGRAELQAQLALLAAQLAEIYRADDAPPDLPAAAPPPRRRS
ncbi:hypothetical protein BD779DRAFT_1669181 [Infundibulicybe gibba]|nr:hypothetical protein BD779DRAFT_1669181 [Infundibulicybe gibba]